MTKDIHLFENGDGGELLIQNGDIALTEKLYQNVYIALFGGNKEVNTKGDELPNVERFDYWANALLFATKPNKQYNSETQRTLSNTTINSSGRLKIQKAVENDLLFLKSISNYEVNVVLLSTDKIEININLSEGTDLQFVWDNAKDEVITDITI